MGAEKAVELGLIGINKYLELKRNIDAYKIATAKPLTTATTRGIWIYGESGLGKSRYVAYHWPGYYNKA